MDAAHGLHYHIRGSDKVRKVAEQKLPDLNTNDVDAAMRILEGTAHSMGLEVIDE